MDPARTSLRRWRIATALAGLTCVVLAPRGRGPAAPAAPAAGSIPRIGALDRVPTAVRRTLRGQLRSRPDEAALLARLATARTIPELERLCAQLALVGGDASVDALATLAIDPRWQAGRAATAALGGIGTDHAVDALLDLAAQGPSWQVSAAMAALAETGTPAARDALTAAALDTDGRYRVDAIQALADLDGAGVVATLSTIAHQGDAEPATAAITALAKLATPEARALIHELARSSDRTVRAAALRATSLDDAEALPLLIGAVSGDDPTAAAAAAEALGNARERSAVATLATLARSGTKDARAAALDALANIGDDHAMAALTALASGTGSEAAAAARALSIRGDGVAAKALVAAIRAQPDPAARVDLLKELGGLPGDDVDELFREVAKTATGAARGVALSHLDSIHDPDTVSIAIDVASQGGRSSYEGIYTLQHSSSPEARAALLALAGQDDAVGADALEALADTAGSDPAVTRLLVARMRTGRGDQAEKASAALAAIGTPDARAAMLEVLRGGDSARAAEVAGALLDAGADRELSDALLEVARADRRPAVRSRAVAELVEVGVEGASDLARQALLHGDPELATSVIGALKYQDSADALALLESAARGGRTAQTRAEAVDAVATRSDPSTIGLFAELAKDADPEVRTSALAGLAGIDTADSIEQLIALSPRGGEAGEALIEHLGSSGQPAAHDELAALIGGRDPQLAVKAIEALSAQSATLDGALRGALTSNDAAVAIAAARRLRESGVALTPAEQVRVDALAAD